MDPSCSVPYSVRERMVNSIQMANLISLWMLLPMPRFCFSTKPEMIGNICILDLDELAAGCTLWPVFFLDRIELSIGDVLFELLNFESIKWSTGFSGNLITKAKDVKENGNGVKNSQSNFRKTSSQSF